MKLLRTTALAAALMTAAVSSLATPAQARGWGWRGGWGWGGPALGFAAGALVGWRLRSAILRLRLPCLWLWLWLPWLPLWLRLPGLRLWLPGFQGIIRLLPVTSHKRPD